MNSEQKLLMRARELDEQALAEIYDGYNAELFRYALRTLGNEDLAEECVAETFSRFLHVLNKGGGPTQYLRAYLYRIAHNWVTDQYRRLPQEERLLQEETIDHSSDDPHQAVAQGMARQELRLALQKLTPDQRQVITLKYLEGWKNDEIARALNKPIGAVKSLQHRGLHALRRNFGNEVQEQV
ncbi:MAG: RNA polymerase sigma factor [Chloroflexota bacterium]|nr:RNA polymerase sigma factor [Chloroflexota bacterium]